MLHFLVGQFDHRVKELQFCDWTKQVTICWTTTKIYIFWSTSQKKNLLNTGANWLGLIQKLTLLVYQTIIVHTLVFGDVRNHTWHVVYNGSVSSILDCPYVSLPSLGTCLLIGLLLFSLPWSSFFVLRSPK